MADSRPPRLLIGVGNPLRSDDGVGPFVAARLDLPGWRGLSHAGDGAGLIELFAAAPDVTVVDATRSGRPPGTLTRIEAHAAPVPAELFSYSTHRFGLAEAVETARALGALPPRLVLYGIEGRRFAPGEGLSPEVEAAARALLAAL